MKGLLIGLVALLGSQKVAVKANSINLKSMVDVTFESVSREADEISEVPDFGAPLSKMYSGYLNAHFKSENVKNYIHYWFVESQAETQATDPLVLWLNGGPGASSLMGFFTEMGPLILDGDEKVMENPYAWSKHVNYLFIESPSGVGFSFCESENNSSAVCHNSDTTTAAQNLAALHAFVDRFPEYKGRDFVITGESYAGVYIPMLAKLVVDDDTLDLNLKTLMVGNPCTDDGTQHRYLGWTLEFAHKNGIIDDKLFYALTDDCGIYPFAPDGKPTSHSPRCTGLYRKYLIALSDDGAKAANLPGGGFLPGYNVWGAKNQPFWDQAARWLNKPEVQKALNVDKMGFEWSLFALRLDYKKEYPACYEGDEGPVYQTSMIEIYQYLSTKLRNIVIYNGDSDPSVQMTGTANAVRNIGKTIKEDHEWRPWFYKTVATPIEVLTQKSPFWGQDLNYRENGIQMAGYVVDYEDGISFVTIHDSGHMCPQYKTIASLHFFRMVLHDKVLSPPLPPVETLNTATDKEFFGDGILAEWVKKAQSDEYIENPY